MVPREFAKLLQLIAGSSILLSSAGPGNGRLGPLGH